MFSRVAGKSSKTETAGTESMNSLCLVTLNCQTRTLADNDILDIALDFLILLVNWVVVVFDTEKDRTTVVTICISVNCNILL